MDLARPTNTDAAEHAGCFVYYNANNKKERQS
jgi:hypothetical protein